MSRGGVIGILLTQVLLTVPTHGAELAVSQDVELYGDDVAGQLALPVAHMEAELGRRGCHVFSRAYWSDTTPLRTLHVEVRCKEENDDERVSLR